MPIRIVGSLCVLICMAMVAAAAGAKGKAGQPADDPYEKIDQVAQSVFASADKNHNHQLSRIEFESAEQALVAAVEQLGSQGLIGQPKKKTSRKDNQQRESTSTANVSPEKLAKSNHVTEAEFIAYGHALVDGAEQQIQQMRAMTDAQRKAFQQQRHVASRPHALSPLLTRRPREARP